MIDLVPTILELAGGEAPVWNGRPVPPAPGRSLVPVLAKDHTVPHDYLWWFHSGNRAIRVGDWKLVSEGEKGPWELYDLAADRSESRNLAAEQPVRAGELEQAWAAHLEEFRRLATQERTGDSAPERPK